MTRRLQGDDGAATTEMAIITPALLLLVMGIVQFGLWYHAMHVARAAADEAARTARAHGGSKAAAEARGYQFLDQQLIPDGTVSADYIQGGTRVRVEVKGHVMSLAFGQNWFEVNAVVESDTERFVGATP